MTEKEKDVQSKKPAVDTVVASDSQNAAKGTKETKQVGDDDEKSYQQKMVWMGTLLEGESDIKGVQDFFLENFQVRMRFKKTIVTLPGQGGDGGRHDAVLSIHKDDVMKFATARFKMGGDCPRWWEDYVDNNREIIPSNDLLE